jgi:hypothetical protein
LGFFFIYINCFAQNNTDTVIVYSDSTRPDSVYIAPPEKEEPKFDSITAYNVSSYTPYQIPDSVLENLKKDEAFWYVNKTPERQKPVAIDPNKKISPPWYTQDWFRTLIWIIIIGVFITVLIWFLIASDVRLFRKKPTVLQSNIDAEITEDIFSVNYEEELEKAIQDENYRLGVRLMYLHVLRLFSESNIIQYKIERTNSDYLLQLFNTSYYKDFFRLTRNFDYVWYGKFDISAAAFNMIQQDYTKLKTSL